MSTNTNTTIIIVIHHGGMLFVLLTIMHINARATVASTTTSLADMHCCLGHVGKEWLVCMIKLAPDLKGTVIINDLKLAII